MIRRNLIALGVAVAGLVALPAVASAGEEILATASYDDTTTYSCRTDALPINPGQNLNLFGGTPDLSQRGRGRRGPASASDFGTNDAGLRHPLQAEHGRDHRRGRRHAQRLRPSSPPRRLAQGQPDVRLGRGEDRGEAPPGLRLPDRGQRRLVSQLHDPQPQRLEEDGRSSITWEIDWVPVASTSGASNRAGNDRVAGRRRRPADLSGLRCRARLRRRRRRRVRLPRRRPGAEPGDPASRRRRRSRPARPGPFPRAGGPWCSAPGTSTPVGSASTSRSRATGMTPARRRRWPHRSGASRSSTPTRSTTSRPARSPGTSA